MQESLPPLPPLPLPTSIPKCGLIAREWAAIFPSEIVCLIEVWHIFALLICDVDSEDCLALNIWTKPGSTGKAVLVWIYGGAFGAGDTAALYYNGARFAAEQDVVVASIK
jgi:hypothetical protein